MIQDHIKLNWLREYLQGFDWLQQFDWEAYVDNDRSESCTLGDCNLDVDLSYDILLHISSYTRPISELRRILLAWLQVANVQTHQVISMDYELLDKNTADVLVTLSVQEVQADVECSAAEAEGWWLRGGQPTPVRLNRDKPADLIFCNV